MFYKLLGIDQDTELYNRNKKLIKQNEHLHKALDIQKRANKGIADRCISLENKLELLEKDAEQFIEIETERRLMQLEDEYKDKMEHKWYCIGRQDAYREMGIKNIEAHKRGNVLALVDGEVIELITDLEDVTADVEGVTTSDEIKIDDLVEVGA